MESSHKYTAFEGNKVLCRGTLAEVVVRVKRNQKRSPESQVLIFNDSTGKSMDFSFHGSEEEVLKRLQIYTTEPIRQAGGPGRPRLGVVSREISLLPRHWEWLASEGGASVVIRRLVEEAKNKAMARPDVKKLQERTYAFMATTSGDRVGYEEALRALYKKDRPKFKAHIESWPSDIQNYIDELSRLVFE